MKNPIEHMHLQKPDWNVRMPHIRRDHDNNRNMAIAVIAVAAAVLLGLIALGASRRSHDHYVDIYEGEE